VREEELFVESFIPTCLTVAGRAKQLKTERRRFLFTKIAAGANSVLYQESRFQ
jgi:hypothetical protein